MTTTNQNLAQDFLFKNKNIENEVKKMYNLFVKNIKGIKNKENIYSLLNLKKASLEATRENLSNLISLNGEILRQKTKEDPLNQEAQNRAIYNHIYHRWLGKLEHKVCDYRYQLMIETGYWEASGEKLTIIYP